jgi:hypothetical protein
MSDFVTGPKVLIVCSPMGDPYTQPDTTPQYEHKPEIVWDANGITLVCARCGKMTKLAPASETLLGIMREQFSALPSQKDTAEPTTAPKPEIANPMPGQGFEP